MKLLLPKSNASTILHVFILDSTSTAGAGKTGLAYNTASLVAKYIKPGGTLTAMTLEDITTLGTYAAPTSAAHLRFKLVDDTNAPGLYEIHLHADTLATNNSIVIMLFGATGMAPVVLEIQLSSINVNDGVRAGMTALPNAAADAAGGLPISDAGGLDLDAKLANTNEITAARMGALTDWINGGRLDLLIDGIKTKTDYLPSATAGQAGGLFIAGMNAATSIVSSSGNALTITSSGGNGCGIIVTGNGLGSGIKTTGGVSGHGIEAILGGGMDTYAIQCSPGSIKTDNLIGNVVGTVSKVASVGSGAIESTSFAAGAITANAIAANAIGASELAADAVAEIGTAVWASSTRLLSGPTNITSTNGTIPITAGGLVGADMMAISADTTAADNAEKVFDNTGYAMSNSSLGSVTGAVGSVTGNVGGNVSGSVASVATGGITAASFAAGAINAAAIADAAIDNATFAADVGSTAYASNIIALAVRKVLDELNLDHFSKVPVANNADMTTEVPDGTVLSNIMTRTGDTSDYAYDTDSLEGLADGASSGGATAQEVWEYATRTLTAATNITAGIADAVWDEASTGHTDAGKAGEQLWTDVDAILADTNELQTDWADGGRLDVLLDAASPGSAGYEVTVTVRTTAGVAISNAMVWASTSSTGSPASEVHYTAANGVATFHLADGTWYFFASGAGYTYDNSANTVTVSGAATSGTFDIGTLIDTALSQTGADSDAFLYRAVNRVRMLTDEPETNAKYSINELVDLIQESHVDILQEVQRVANTPIIATYTFTYSSAVTTYVLPSTVGRVVAIGEISATSGYREFYTSRSRLNAYGKGVKVEGNVISFQGTNYLQNGTTVTVEYEVSGCAKLYTASTAVFTATTLTAGDALLGARDTRPHAYLGCVLRILPNSSNPVEQERIITGQSGDTYNVYTVSEAFSPALAGTVMYEINPPFSKGFDQVVPTQAAMTIAANEGNATRMKTLEVLYNRQIRTLAQMAGHRDGMQGSLNRTDGAFNRRGSRWRNGFVS
jgi:hypothetical protein